MKADKTIKNQQENDAYLSWTRPVLKKGGIVSETLKKHVGPGDGLSNTSNS